MRQHARSQKVLAGIVAFVSHSGKGEHQARTLPTVRPVLRTQAAAMRFGNRPRNRESQAAMVAEALLLRPVGMETLEHLVTRMRRNAWSLVHHQQDLRAVVLRQLEVDAAIGGRKRGGTERLSE